MEKKLCSRNISFNTIYTVKMGENAYTTVLFPLWIYWSKHLTKNILNEGSSDQMAKQVLTADSLDIAFMLW